MVYPLYGHFEILYGYNVYHLNQLTFSKSLIFHLTIFSMFSQDLYS